MLHRFQRLSFQARLTLVIAASFIAAIAVILILGLILARRYDIGFISMAMPLSEEDMDFILEPASDTAEPSTVGVMASGESIVWIEGESGDGYIPTQAAGLPTLARWAAAILGGFAVLAIALAWWISHRSLRRIDHITHLAAGLSEHRLDQRLNLTGPQDEIRHLGDTFDTMLDRLERGFANQRQFIANASHELRTPLSTARLALEIPLDQHRVPADLQPDLRAALNATIRSEHLIAQLLILAQGQLTLTDTTPVNVAALVETVITDLHPQAESASITVESALQSAEVAGNATLLGQAVRNLVQNAIQHNQPHGSIKVTLVARAETAILTVENTGTTYTVAEARLLTEPFHRHTNTRLAATEGTGLGLAIVSSIVTVHGGTLTMTPRPGGGLIIETALPIAGHRNAPATRT